MTGDGNRTGMADLMSAPTQGRLAEWWSLGRAVAGGVMYLVPRAAGRTWVGQLGSDGSVALVTRSFAVRDLALGLGALEASRNSRPTSGWLRAALLSDLGDLIGAFFLPRSGRRLLLGAVSAASVAVDAALLLAALRSGNDLDPPSPTRGAPAEH